MTIFGIYAVVFAMAYIIWEKFISPNMQRKGFTSLKVVTFGDSSAVTANRIASVISVVTVFLLWGAFTGSKITFIHAPAPYIGETSFTYTAQDTSGQIDNATVTVIVHAIDEKPEKAPININQDTGFAKDDSLTMVKWRTKTIRVKKNDLGGDDKKYLITHVNNMPIIANEIVDVDNGTVKLTKRGSLSFTPTKGWQMEPIWLPAPESVVKRLFEIASEGYQNNSLLENLGFSLYRVLMGFLFGTLLGVPLGFAMGLSSWVRGWFDPIVEFMRPIPPLALIPLVIIWFGIHEQAKIILLFLAALWIMTIAGRAGASGVAISKVHAAYSLGASKWVILTRVIFPNALPDIFTGARVAMGVCWGTVVAAELVAAEKGAGQMIMVASKFQLTDIVIMGIILIGIIGYAIDILMREIESFLVPWKGK